MTIPYDNWQFWLVTLAMFWGLYIIIRPFLPRPGAQANEGGPACTNCAIGAAANHKPRPTKAKLTIKGRKAPRKTAN